MNDELYDSLTEETNLDTPIEISESQEVQEEVSSPSIEELNETISRLKEELEGYRSAEAERAHIAKQLDEFSELFPEISVRSIPDEVWDSVKEGNSLAAAYSVYERRITEAARRIELINAKNAQQAAGAAGKDVTSEFFSADDVRKMSPSEVRVNYAKIRRSMEKWN